MSRDPPPPSVLKFGGATLEQPRLVADRVAASRRCSGGTVVVLSARRGVTDRLLLAIATPRDRAGHDRLVRSLRARHPGAAREREPILEELRAAFRELERRPRAAGELGPRILASGERLATVWFAERLRRRGAPAGAVGADRAGLRVRSRAGRPTIDLAASRSEVRRTIAPLLASRTVPVVTGFFGVGARGEVRTLGRGGSDYSAVAIGLLLAARSVELVKVDGPIRSADPASVRRARPIARLDFGTAQALARSGAKVLHPAAIALARRHGLTLRVRGLGSADPPTLIGPRRPGRPSPRLVASRRLRAGAPASAASHRPRPPELPPIPSGSEAAPPRAPVGRLELRAPSARRSRGDAVPRRVGAGERPMRRGTEITLVTTFGVPAAEVRAALHDGAAGLALGYVVREGRSILAVPPASERRALAVLHRLLVERAGAAPGASLPRTKTPPEGLFSRRSEATGGAR
jgi:aspartate kinase